MKFSHEVTFQVGDEVWLRADPESHGFVVGILFRSCGVEYLVQYGQSGECRHYDFELSKEKILTP